VTRGRTLRPMWVCFGIVLPSFSLLKVFCTPFFTPCYALESGSPRSSGSGWLPFPSPFLSSPRRRHGAFRERRSGQFCLFVSNVPPYVAIGLGCSFPFPLTARGSEPMPTVSPFFYYRPTPPRWITFPLCRARSPYLLFFLSSSAVVGALDSEGPSPTVVKNPTSGLGVLFLG